MQWESTYQTSALFEGFKPHTSFIIEIVYPPFIDIAEIGMKLEYGKSKVSNNQRWGKTTAVLSTMQGWAALHLF